MLDLAAAEALPILLVDDQPENLRTLEAVLDPLGYPLRTASSGELLFELYQKRGIHVVGFTARGLRIQVLTQSGDSFESILVKIGPGFRMSVSKPFVLWHA